MAGLLGAGLALAAAIRAHGLVSRYLNQVAKASLALQQLEADPRITPLWEIIRSVGKGLPQEYFHSGMARQPYQGTPDSLGEQYSGGPLVIRQHKTQK